MSSVKPPVPEMSPESVAVTSGASSEKVLVPTLVKVCTVKPEGSARAGRSRTARGNMRTWISNDDNARPSGTARLLCTALCAATAATAAAGVR